MGSLDVACLGAEAFFQWSGATTSAWVRGQTEEAVWYTESAFRRAERQAADCWQAGGRYWETLLESGPYLSSLRIGTPEDPECGECWGHLAGHLQLPEKLLGGLCAPDSCEEPEVRSKAFPAFLSHSLHFSFLLPAPAPEHLKVAELSHWSQLR
ncbi:unnamed protein product, partial [Effrenium voratum]